jgi:hypothetical protein
VQGAGFKGSRVQGAGCRVQGAGCRVQGAGCRICWFWRAGAGELVGCKVLRFCLRFVVLKREGERVSSFRFVVMREGVEASEGLRYSLALRVRSPPGGLASAGAGRRHVTATSALKLFNR